MHTRFLRHVAALGVAITCLAARPSHLSAQAKHGDVSGEGIISALDAQAILTAVVGLPLPAGYIVANGVAVCDGRATPGALDAQVVLSYAIGLPVTQYCVGQPFGPGATMVVVEPRDSSVLVNRTLTYRALLKQANGSLIKRPVAWSSSAPAVAAIDSVRGDSLAFVRGVTGGSSTITATSDGVSFATQLKVFLSYAGIVITPQRPGTFTQIGATPIFYAKDRDSVGVVSGTPAGFWSVTDTTIAKVVSPGKDTARYYANVQTLAQGTTYLKVRSQVNPAAVDSVAITTALPTVAACTEGTGTMHQNVTYTTPQSWTIATQPHFVSGSVSFAAGANLTIQPGTLVCLNSGATMMFSSGARLIARGKPDSLIKFVATNPAYYWYYIQLGDPLAYGTTAPADTSVITNALIENTYQGIYGREQHVVIADSVRVRQFYYGGVQVLSPGSRLSRSVVDTSAYTGTGYAVTVGRGTVENTTIRPGPTSVGVYLTDSGTVKTVSIIGGVQGITSTYYSPSGAHLNDVTITGTTGIALDLPYATVGATSANVQITGGTGGAFRGQIGNVGILFPDSLKQETLKGNGKDTIFVTGGSLIRSTITTRSDLPWRVTSYTYVDTAAKLVAVPGTQFRFECCGFTFRNGGTLSAVGQSLKRIVFKPDSLVPNATFYGLAFENPPPGPTPSLAPYDTSTLSYVQVDSASGVYAYTGFGYYAAINAGDHHTLLIDSLIVRKAHAGAVYLAAKGSQLSASRIDTTGTIVSNYVSSYPAVKLGDSTLMQTTRVLRSGQVGVEASGIGARLLNVRVVGSLGTGIVAEAGRLGGDLGTVRADSANAAPFRGTIQNLAVLAPDSTSQVSSFLPVAGPGNVSNVLEITGGTLAGTPGTHTASAPLIVKAIPQLRWLVRSTTYIDALAQLAAGPGAQFRFTCCGFTFQNGGTLNAVGQSLKRIVFKPDSLIANATFYGLEFENPPPGATPALAPYDTSTLSYVQVDSASGVYAYNGFGYYAAINAGDHHTLLIDSLIVRKAHAGAVYLAAKGSKLIGSFIDTTGTIQSLYVSSYPAVRLNDFTSITNTTISRSGNIGIVLDGQGITMSNVRVTRSVGVGIDIVNNTRTGGSQGLSLSGFKVDSGSVGGVAVEADTVTLTNCLVRDNGTTTSHHGIYTTYLYKGVVISACDLINNKGYGVFNYDSIPGASAPKTTIITANSNFWGDAAGPTGPLGDGVGGNVSTATPCAAACSGQTLPTVASGSGVPPAPAVPAAEYVCQRPRRSRRRRRRRSS